MSNELIVAIVSGLLSIVATLISVLSNRKVEALRQEVFGDRLLAYKKLWSLLEPLTPTKTDSLPDGTRERLEEALKRWYYADGNGVFLSANAQKQYLFARKVLRREIEPSSDADLREAFSKLRTELKVDVEVYKGSDRKRKLG